MRVAMLARGCAGFIDGNAFQTKKEGATAVILDMTHYTNSDLTLILAP
jgi:hypothetical protein